MSKVKIITPPMKALFPSLDKHEEYGGISTNKFACTFIIEDEDRKVFEDAVKEAGGGQGKSPLALIDADSQYDAGKMKFKAKSGWAVKVVDVKGQPVTDLNTVAGGTVRAQISFKDYAVGASRGVSALLGTIQVLKPGDSGTVDFGEVPEEYQVNDTDGEFDDPLPF